ncbi:MAG: hypothetical protein ACLFT9_24090, partial [Coleofasciculus sp.]
MSTLEFTAKVQDGKIEVPEAYRQLLQNIDCVKITVTSNSVSTQVINEVCVNLIKKALMSETEIQPNTRSHLLMTISTSTVAPLLDHH